MTQISADVKKDTETHAIFGNGFSEKSLRRMMQFSEVFPDREIVVSLIRHLRWTHILALIPPKQPLQRDFYAEMCRVDRWSVRTPRAKIRAMLYERTAVSKKPEEVAKAAIAALRREGRLTPARRRVHGWRPARWTMSEPTNETAHGSPTGYDVIPDETIQRTVTTKAA